MRKIRFLAFGLLSIISITLTSCTWFKQANLVKEEYLEKDVIIEDAYHRDAYYSSGYNYQYGIDGKYYPAYYNDYHRERNVVKVKYEDAYKTFDNKTLYEKYAGCIGQTVKGTVRFRTYDDGMIYYNIVGLS